VDKIEDLSSQNAERSMPKGIHRSDRRIRKTRTVLHEALASLVREKDYDDIVVKEILDRANVGRSTFYMHFRNKDDLLAASIHELLHSIPKMHAPATGAPHEGIIAFSLPVFEHIHAHRHAGRTKIGPRGRAILHEHLKRILVDFINASARQNNQLRRRSPARLPQDLLVRHVASTFVLVLNWWMESNSPLSPSEVNELYRGMLLPTLKSATG
jgi:AcrR family transcriptional regulator